MLISRRVFLREGGQKSLLRKIQRKVSIKEMADLCGCSERTLRDWLREKYSMDLICISKLCKKSYIPLPREKKLKERYWYVSLGSSAGGKAIMRKYGAVGGDPSHRKKKWQEWWKREGKTKPHPVINAPFPIRKPSLSEDLAEFVGIEMGDGGMSKYQLTITLHHKDDKQYVKFVAALIEKLFNVKPNLRHVKKDSVINIVVSRIELIKFCNEKLGLKIGNKIKQKLDIPSWIKRNKKFQVACMRGLIDTDGSVFAHRYKVGKNWYGYKKLSFSSHSRPLLISVYRILKNIGLNPRLTSAIDVRLDRVSDVQKYFKLVGSSNPKHWKRYRNKTII